MKAKAEKYSTVIKILIKTDLKEKYCDAVLLAVPPSRHHREPLSQLDRDTLVQKEILFTVCPFLLVTEGKKARGKSCD